jgi:hypothetical protein
MANQPEGQQGGSRPPWLWYGAALAMLIAIIVAIVDDDDGPEGIGSGDVEALLRGSSSGDTAVPAGQTTSQDEIDEAVDALIDRAFGGAFSGDASEILVVNDRTQVNQAFSVQDMLDGDGFSHDTVALVGEGGRERTGVQLGGLMEKAGMSVWERLVVYGVIGDSIEVTRDQFDEAPDQFLLYWSSGPNPSATVSLVNPFSGESVTDVVNIIIAE